MNAGFADRLDWLLATVPRVPGSSERFSTEDLIATLAPVAPGAGASADSARMARRWLAEMRTAGATVGSDWASNRFVAALEDLLRLPIGYFRSAEVAAAADARIAFAAASGEVRLIGPCRVLRSEIPTEQLHALHREITTALQRRRAAS